jgi:recombinational DNA repair protein (RecF pathway)
MNFRDRAIIISKKPLKEHSCIITVLTEKHGIYSGVMQQYNKKALA